MYQPVLVYLNMYSSAVWTVSSHIIWKMKNRGIHWWLDFFDSPHIHICMCVCMCVCMCTFSPFTRISDSLFVHLFFPIHLISVSWSINSRELSFVIWLNLKSSATSCLMALISASVSKFPFMMACLKPVIFCSFI